MTDRLALTDELRAAAKDAEDVHGKPLSDWDGWRQYISNGGGASWPRDDFESWLGFYAELMTRVADALEASE